MLVRSAVVISGNPLNATLPFPRGGPRAYAAAVAITGGAILSQYVLPERVAALRPLYGNLLGDLLVVYGIPILAFAVLVGFGPLARFASAPGKAAVEGLRWYGIASVLALLLTVALAVVYLALDPSALHQLTAPNPDLKAATGDPWLWVALSFPIGLLEETIFRGWFFGYWLARRTPRWLLHAGWTSLLFAGVHLYYATTYGAAAGLIFPMLFLLGFGFAVAMRFSGGNVLVVGLLHGAYDSAAFLTLVSTTAGIAFRYGLIGIALLVAGVVYLARNQRVPPGSAPFG
jgi:membrane protease YdiL (CAAX protease family)